MASLFQLVNQLAVRAVGRNPRWSVQEDTTGAPSSSSAGVNIRNAVRTLVQVALREQAHQKTARVTIGFEDGTEYRVTIDGNNVDTVVQGDTEDEGLQQIADAINNNKTVSGIVSALVEDGAVKIQGASEANYTIATSVVSGTGTIDHTADATEASIRVWLRDGGTGDRPERWTIARELAVENLDYRGDTIVVPSAGYRRMYVEVFGEDGDVQVSIGPGARE